MKIVIGCRKDHASDDILKLAALRAKAFNAEVYVIGSLKGGQGDKLGDIKKAEQNIDYAIECLKELGIEQRMLVRGQNPGEDIVQFAQDNKADEVIVGIVKMSKVGKLLLSSWTALHGLRPWHARMLREVLFRALPIRPQPTLNNLPI
jgi:nucleotide-binding universal stress UspA family protein